MAQQIALVQATNQVASAPTATLTIPQTTLNLPEDYFNVSVHIISKLIIEKDDYPVPHDERVVEVKVPEISFDKVVDALSRVLESMGALLHHTSLPKPCLRLSSHTATQLECAY